MSLCTSEGLLYVKLEKNKNTTGSFKVQLSSLTLPPSSSPPHPTMERNRLATSYRSQLAVQHPHLWQDLSAFLCIFQTGANKRIVNYRFLSPTAQGSLPIPEEMLSSLHESANLICSLGDHGSSLSLPGPQTFGSGDNVFHDLGAL